MYSEMWRDSMEMECKLIIMFDEIYYLDLFIYLFDGCNLVKDVNILWLYTLRLQQCNSGLIFEPII